MSDPRPAARRTWQDRGVVVTQATSFPYPDRTKLTIHGAGKFSILIRVPHWAVNGIYVSMNGQSTSIAEKT